MTTLFTAFTDLLDELGISPSGDTFERMRKERELMTALEQVRDFPVEMLPQIKEYALEQSDGRKAVKNPHKLIEEMRRVMAQDRLKDDGRSDEFIDRYERRKWEWYRDLDRDDLPPHGQVQYDYLKKRYGKEVA